MRRLGLSGVVQSAAAVVVFGCLFAQGARGDDDIAPPELPMWPISLYLPPEFKGTLAASTNPAAGQSVSTNVPKGDILVWAPPEAKKIRAFLVIPNNAQSKRFGEYPKVREAAVKHGMAVVYLRSDAAMVADDKGAVRAASLERNLDAFQTLMDYIAAKSGIPGLKHAPFIAYGQSSRGQFPFRLAWKYPHRTIATIDHHAETPTWPPEEWAKFEDETILHVNLNGELEWGATFAVHVRPSLLNYRAKTPWLPHMALAQGIDHTNYATPEPPPGQNHTGKATQSEVWDYLSVFVDKALALRLPADASPADGPVKLRKVDPSTGYLIEPFALEDILCRPRLYLEETNGLFVVAPKQPSLNGYAEIPPAADYVPPAGVPIVTLASGVSPTNWLLTEGLQMVMKADPCQDVSAFTALRPKPGDAIEIDGKKTVFSPITEAQIGRREGGTGGITSKVLARGSRKLTFLGYTVLDVREPKAFKVACGVSLAVRGRLILNGVPVDHNQVVRLGKGLYPMLLAVRMDAIIWGSYEPSLGLASDEEVADAKASDTGKRNALAEFEARMANKRPPLSYLHKYNDVPEAERSRMLWIADEEQARAWVQLHDPELRRPK